MPYDPKELVSVLPDYDRPIAESGTIAVPPPSEGRPRQAFPPMKVGAGAVAASALARPRGAKAIAIVISQITYGATSVFIRLFAVTPDGIRIPLHAIPVSGASVTIVSIIGGEIGYSDGLSAGNSIQTGATGDGGNNLIYNYTGFPSPSAKYLGPLPDQLAIEVACAAPFVGMVRGEWIYEE